MNWAPGFSEVIAGLKAVGGPIVEEFQSLQAAWTTWAGREHNTDGTHSDITCDTITAPATNFTVMTATGAVIGTLQVTGDITGIQFITGQDLIATRNVVVSSQIRLGINTTISSGTADPNGAVSGYPGDLYCRYGAGAGTSFYVKESGGGTTTGWVGK